MAEEDGPKMPFFMALMSGGVAGTTVEHRDVCLCASTLRSELTGRAPDFADRGCRLATGDWRERTAYLQLGGRAPLCH